jgi:exosortase
MSRVSGRTIAACLTAAGAFLMLYSRVLVDLVHDWATDDNYSHGFLIIPVAAYFVWERRAKLATIVAQPSNWGLALVLASLAVLVAGTLGSEFFLTRVSMLGIVAGSMLFLGGWSYFRTLLFPLAFLLLMIPIPEIIFNQIAFPLQLIASQFGTGVMSLASVPVLREGNVIVLSNTTLEVAEACSGMRSLISLLTLGIVLGYFTDCRVSVRTAIALATVPIAIFANGLRVAGTGVAAYYYGPEAAEGFLHTFSGWLVFVAAMMLLVLLQRGLSIVMPATNDVDVLPQRTAA